jgi:hypothetical protein
MGHVVFPVGFGEDGFGGGWWLTLLILRAERRELTRSLIEIMR